MRSALVLLALSVGAAEAAAPRGWELTLPLDIQSLTIAQDPDGSGVLYALATDRVTSLSGAYRSADSGLTWGFLTGTPPGETGAQPSTVFASDIAIDPTEPSRIYLLSQPFSSSPGEVFVSTNGGGEVESLDAPHTKLIALSASGHFLYAGTSQGFYRLQIDKNPPPVRTTRGLPPR